MEEQSDMLQYFSADAAKAKQRFLDAAGQAGAALQAIHPDPGVPEQSIDTAVLGSEGGPTLVLSSGVHGLELLFGSAVQLAVLHRLLEEPDWLQGLRLVMIHAVNPFGAQHLRRFDADNIDLNRNFLLPDQSYAGGSETYDKLNSFINPPRPPQRWEAFWPKILAHIARYGFANLKQALGGGQYEHPKGLFFGGMGPSRSMKPLMPEVGRLIGDASSVAHLDFHTGLGAFGSCAMLVDGSEGDADGNWCKETFGTQETQFLSGDSIAYKAEGSFGGWMRSQFPHIPYRIAAAEFGTYGPIRVFRALRAENQAHHYAKPDEAAYAAAKAEALECFVPKDPLWRTKTLTKALEVTDRARTALLKDAA